MDGNAAPLRPPGPLIVIVATALTAILVVFIARPAPDGGLSLAEQPKTVHVVASTSVFADLAANVGGTRASTTSLMPRGADPHAWEPSTREARTLTEADIFVYNGLGLEPWAPRIVAGAGHSELLSIRLSSGLEPIRGAAFGLDDEHDGDPHFWLDITNAIHYVRLIEDALRTKDPAGADYYRRRADDYVAELTALDAWFQDQIDTIAPDRRAIVTYHDAFAYMARRYGLRLGGFVVRNPDREPSPREMARLITSVADLSVPAVFGEPHINPRLAEALAAETGVRVAILYADALTDDVPTYVDMMRTNAHALVEALQK